jgi:hypothetical protein
LVALAVLAAGLAAAAAIRGNLRPAAQVPPPPPAAAAAAVQPAPPPAAQELLAPQGGGIAFREVVEAPSAAGQQAPQTCINCWNKAHSGLDAEDKSLGASLAASLRPIKYSTGRSPLASQFGLPNDITFGHRMGERPASWEQCPTP